MLPAEVADAYRHATLEVISAGQMVRKFEMPNAFVVDYVETFGNQEGTGTFLLKIKQKKEMTYIYAILRVSESYMATFPRANPPPWMKITAPLVDDGLTGE